MGIHDREYLREEPPAGFQLSAPQSMVVIIIGINVAVFVANMFFGGRDDTLTTLLSANVYSLIRPWLWWQLVTAGFAHDPNGIRHILFNMVGLFFLGREVERVLGRWEFLRFYLVAIVVGCVVHLGRVYLFIPQMVPGPGAVMYDAWQVQLLGASAGVAATVMLFIFRFPNVKILLFFAIPMPAWVLGVIFIVSELIGAGLFRSIIGDNVMAANVAYDAHLGGMAFAALYFYFHWNFGRLIPRRAGDLLAGFGNTLKRKPKLRVHAPDADDHGDYDHQDAEADRILIKIDREGMDSLTTKERKILEEYSRRMQQKHR